MDVLLPLGGELSSSQEGLAPRQRGATPTSALAFDMPSPASAMQRFSALIQGIGDVPHPPGFLAELRAALISGECPLEAHDDARTDTHGLLCTAQLSATSMDDLLGDCAGLRDELSSGPKDCFVMLKAACMLVEHHPQVYGGGDGADVGSVLLVLVPALADSRLCGAHDLIVKTIYQLVQLIVQSSEPAPVRLFFEDLVDLLAASLEGPDARSHHDDMRCLKRIAALVEREGKSGASSERARMEDSWVRLQLPFARNQLSDKIVSTMLLILPGCAHLLANCTRPIWNLACRTVLNTPHAQCIKLFELLACLCERYQAPAIWGDKLCQALVWSIRYQNRLAPPGAAAKPNKDVEGKPKKQCVMEHARMLDSVAQSLARCINAAFHTIPAAVRHVHAENWVSWALEYLEVQPSRNINLSRALLSTLATNVSDCPSLVPNIMRLSGLMHDIQLQDAISTCLKRVFSVLLVSPAHGNVLLSFLRGRTENAVAMGTACGAWAVQSESSQDRVMKDATSEHGRGKKRHRVLEGADLTASKRQSFNGSQSASTMSAGNAASDNLASTVFEELLTKFLQACLLSKGAESAPESDLNLQAAVQQRGLLSAMCVASEFSRENKQSTGAPVGRVSHTIARTIFQFINMIASFPMQKPVVRGAYTTSEIYFRITDGAFSSIHARFRNYPALAIGARNLETRMSHFWNWHYGNVSCLGRLNEESFRDFIMRVFSISPGSSRHSTTSAPLLALRLIRIYNFYQIYSDCEVRLFYKINNIVFHYHVGTSIYGSLPPYPSETLSRKTDQCYHSENQYGQCYSNE